MPFIKLDCGILHSSLWPDTDARNIFITALLMAIPHEVVEPIPQINTDNLDNTGWEVPPGWYGWVEAAGPGIAHMCGIDDKEIYIPALYRLASPDPDSRSAAHEGRRMVRVDGGFIILNFMVYRDKDHTSAERQKRYRERKKAAKPINGVARNVKHPLRDVVTK